MNEMYKYLQEHSYISENKKSNYQSELSEQRAECIANKYNSLVQDLKQENQKYKEVINKAIEYIEKDYSYTKRHDIPLLTKDEQLAGKLLDILKEVE